MNTTCYIIDFQPYCIDMFTKLIKVTPGLELIGSETNLFVGIEWIIQGRIKPDITLLAASFSQTPSNLYAHEILPFTEVVFTTSYFGIAEFERDQLLYMVNPIRLEKFKKIIDQAKALITAKRVL